MSAAALPAAEATGHSQLERMRAALAAAGAAVLAGSTGKLLCGALGFSTFVVGPAITGGDRGIPTKNVPTAPAGVSPSEHEAHHE